MRLMFSFLLALASAPPPQSFDPDPEDRARRVLVIYNSNWPDADGDGVNDSEQVARHFARLRGVPEANLFPVAVSVGGWSYNGLAGWQAFWDEFLTPLRSALAGTPENYVLGFVLCHGIPYEINNTNPNSGTRSLDESVIRLWDLGDRDNPPFNRTGTNLYFEASPTIPPDKGRFDPALDRWLGERTYLVTRLDAPDAHRSQELVDFALYGDAYIGTAAPYYTGRGYVDTRYGPWTWGQLAGYPFGHGSYTYADMDMAYGRQWVEQAGFPLLWEPWETEIGEPGATFENGASAALAPDALWYYGWYNFLKYQDVWEWLPGSAGCDLDSFSIGDIRAEDPRSFLGKGFRRGLTCGLGSIAEPLLSGHPYPEVFTYYLLDGFPFAEAARVSDPWLIWRNLYIGDFLYQPTRIGRVPLLDTQPPPPCAVKVEIGATPDERVFRTELDTAGFLPDVGLLTVHHGPTPAYGQTVSGEDARPRIFHTARVAGLGADELLHFRADYTDPAGNTGLGRDYILHTALAGQPVLARIAAPDTVPAGTSFEMEVVLGAQAGVSTLTSYSVTVTSAVLGWNRRNVVPLILGLNPRFFDAPDRTLRSARFTVPGTLPPDAYLIEASAASPAGSDTDSHTLLVQ